MNDKTEKSSSEMEEDISTQLVTPPNYSAMRGKRRWDEEYTADLANLRDEMKKMFSTLMETQDTKFKKFESSLNEIKKTNQNIESSMNFLTAQNKEFREKIEKLESQIKEDRKYIAILEDKVEDMQKNRRKTNLEIKNVPKNIGEGKDELISMMISLSKTIGCQMDKSDIKDIYRVRGKKESAQNTPIIVETSSTLLKNDVLKMCKAYNVKDKYKLRAKHLGLRTNEDTPIFVSEQLTAKAARLYFLARDLAKTRSYRFCWTAYGKVYVRKEENSRIILIKNELQVHQLMNEI